jgi:hypothetical protein
MEEPHLIEHAIDDVGRDFVRTMEACGLGEDRAHVEPGIEMRRRRLEEHLRPLPEMPQLCTRERAHVLAEHLDLAVVHLEEPERGASERGLSRPALADEPENLAALDAEIDVVDRREAGA